MLHALRHYVAASNVYQLAPRSEYVKTIQELRPHTFVDLVVKVRHGGAGVGGPAGWAGTASTGCSWGGGARDARGATRSREGLHQSHATKIWASVAVAMAQCNHTACVCEIRACSVRVSRCAFSAALHRSCRLHGCRLHSIPSLIRVRRVGTSAWMRLTGAEVPLVCAGGGVW